MITRSHHVLAVLVVVGLVLSACGPTAEPPKPAEPPAATEQPVEPTEAPKPTEPPAATEQPVEPTEAPKPTKAPAATEQPTEPPPTEEAAEPPAEEEVCVRIVNYEDSGEKMSMDPAILSSGGDAPYVYAVYERLVDVTPDFSW